MNFDSKVVLTTIGPVIGAHSGPGTIAVFTITDKRA
jgi:fatty acid-binding protein DegV